MDLIDDQSNDGNVNGKNSKEGDKVSGYTIRQIEDKLNGARSWNAWRDKLKQINNSTKNGIDALFKVWE
jgi:fibrillarin-like rRNA methylase